jgi:hypothetical protein
MRNPARWGWPASWCGQSWRQLLQPTSPWSQRRRSARTQERMGSDNVSDGIYHATQSKSDMDQDCRDGEPRKADQQQVQCICPVWVRAGPAPPRWRCNYETCMMFTYIDSMELPPAACMRAVFFPLLSPLRPSHPQQRRQSYSACSLPRFRGGAEAGTLFVFCRLGRRKCSMVCVLSVYF